MHQPATRHQRICSLLTAKENAESQLETQSLFFQHLSLGKKQNLFAVGTHSPTLEDRQGGSCLRPFRRAALRRFLSLRTTLHKKFNQKSF